MCAYVYVCDIEDSWFFLNDFEKHYDQEGDSNYESFWYQVTP